MVLFSCVSCLEQISGKAIYIYLHTIKKGYKPKGIATVRTGALLNRTEHGPWP